MSKGTAGTPHQAAAPARFQYTRGLFLCCAPPMPVQPASQQWDPPPSSHLRQLLRPPADLGQQQRVPPGPKVEQVQQRQGRHLRQDAGERREFGTCGTAALQP